MLPRRPKRPPRGPQEARLCHAPVLDSAVQGLPAPPRAGLELERARSARDGSSSIRGSSSCSSSSSSSSSST
eukprot:2992721-Pyramimonas_sp.AAC.1